MCKKLLWFFIRIFVIHMQRVTNLIVHYEKFGQDPQKRSLPDRLLSFNCILNTFNLVPHSIIIIVRTLFGPVGFAVTDFRYYLMSSFATTILLGFSEAILVNCMMLFSWKTYVMVNDEFFSTFLNLFNIMMGQMFSIIRFQTAITYGSLMILSSASS